MKYYVHTTTDSQGDYEVHKEGCTRMPAQHNRRYLGDFSSCTQAVNKAKGQGFIPANGCYWCSRPCHTS